MRLAKVSFQNSTGAKVQVFYKQAGKFAGDTTDLDDGNTTDEIEGTLLTVDVVRDDVGRRSYDFTNHLPNGVLVEDESPYKFSQVLGSDGVTMELVIEDNTGDEVGSFSPVG